MQVPAFRRLVLIILIFLVALLRAERGVAELQGRAGEPSRLFRLVPEGDGRWVVSLLGLQRSLQTRVVLISTGRPLLEMRRALPEW